MKNPRRFQNSLIGYDWEDQMGAAFIHVSRAEGGPTSQCLEKSTWIQVSIHKKYLITGHNAQCRGCFLRTVKSISFIVHKADWLDLRSLFLFLGWWREGDPLKSKAIFTHDIIKTQIKYRSSNQRENTLYIKSVQMYCSFMQSESILVEIKTLRVS